MEISIPGWLWPITAFGGLGALVDFIIGRAGQDRVRGLLETWWIKFDDVHWHNFGREEAHTAVAVMDRVFGANLLSLRRVVPLFAIHIILIVLLCVVVVIRFAHWPDFNIGWVRSTVYLCISTLSIAKTVSVTRSIAEIAAKRLKNGVIRNAATFVALVFLKYMFIGVAPAAEFTKEQMIAAFLTQGTWWKNVLSLLTLPTFIIFLSVLAAIQPIIHIFTLQFVPLKH
jgi:hypothetical protein